jgi:sugar O-acyltransferase (sialic acid O-acetyltransferase NeuD family)
VSDLGDLVVIGGGGHAKVVVSTALSAGWRVVAVLDDAADKRGTDILGVPVSGGVDMIVDLASDGAVIAVGDNRARKTLSDRINSNWVTIVHPSAVVHPTVTLGHGTVVFAGVVIQPDTVIGDHAIINTSTSIDHDCRIGAFCHIAPGSNLAGSVTVGEGTFFGIGTRAIPGVMVGRWSTIGAGGVVIDEIPDGVTAVGVPARPSEGF